MSNDPNPFRLSVSKAKTFNHCHKQYEYNYILKFPKKQRDYLIYGTFMHEILENFHQEYIQGCNDPYNITMAKVYKAALIEYKSKLSVEALKDAYECIDQYLQKLANDQNPPQILAVEKQFNIDLGNNIIFNGLIDRIQIDPDGVVCVLDYKTTKNKKYLQGDYEQLAAYAFSIHHEDPSIKIVRGRYSLLRHNFEEITTEFNLEQILKVKDTFQDYAKTIQESTIYTASPDFLCNYCDFLEHCDEGKAFTNKGRAPIKHGQTNW